MFPTTARLFTCERTVRAALCPPMLVWLVSVPTVVVVVTVDTVVTVPTDVRAPLRRVTRRSAAIPRTADRKPIRVAIS